MSKQYNFVDQLKEKLTEYNILDSDIKNLEERKEAIRTQIEAWMDQHDENLFETADTMKQLWKLSKMTKTSNRVKDYDMLKQVLPAAHQHLIVQTESTSFGMRRIDKHSSEWNKKNI